MPELPEVETVRRGLEATLVGRRIERVSVTGARTVRRTSPGEVVAGLTGATPTAARRRGKYLLLDLDTGEQSMIHLRMSGQLRWAAHGDLLPPHTHVVLDVAGQPAAGAADDRALQRLLFVDPRTFGEVVVFDPAFTGEVVPELARLGVDPIADPFDRATLADLLRPRARQLKSLLLDQHVIAGIGNIYADEILHAARLHPMAIASHLTPHDVTRLHEAIVGVLGEAVERRGSTLPDARYLDLMGAAGDYQSQHRVYGRTGLRCLTCRRGIIRRLNDTGRSTAFCPVCQRRCTRSAGSSTFRPAGDPCEL